MRHTLALPIAMAAAAVAAGSARHLNGTARLIAFESVPDALSCEWMPDESAPAAQASTARGDDDVASRKPLRWIQDPNPSFSSVAVDSARNEVVLLDANRFDILARRRVSAR